MSVKNKNTEKKNLGRNWSKLKNIYPCGFTNETATVQKIPLSDNVRSFV